jgi:hypothetical protein
VIILFGFRRKSSRLGTIFVVCGYCHTPAAHALTKIRKYFTLFFVPVIPLDTKYAITCTMCGRASQITKETAETYAAHANENPAGSNVPGTPNPAPAASSSGQSNMAEAPAIQSNNHVGVIYCSWCGKERAVNANALHYCGSMERPAVYCMSCGSLFENGATTCNTCGTPVTALSR